MTITFDLLAIALTLSVMLHVTEEFIFPGGFPAWYARLIPSKSGKQNSGNFLVWINTFMMFICALALYFGDNQTGYTFWYYNASIAAANACFHLWGVFKLKAYSPGVVTGVLLYIPLFIIGTIYLTQSTDFPFYKVVIGIALGLGYHIFSIKRQAN